MTETAERIVLASRPVGEPTLDNFRLEELPIPQPGPGQMLLPIIQRRFPNPPRGKNNPFSGFGHCNFLRLPANQRVNKAMAAC